MGFMDIFKGKKSRSDKCAWCEKESDKKLKFKKKFDEGTKYFCSKKCSSEYRKDRKKKAKKPVDAGGSGLPW